MQVDTCAKRHYLLTVKSDQNMIIKKMTEISPTLMLIVKVSRLWTIQFKHHVQEYQIELHQYDVL